MVVCGCGVQDGEGGNPGAERVEGGRHDSSSRMGKADEQSEKRAREDQVHGQFQQGLGPGCAVGSQLSRADSRLAGLLRQGAQEQAPVVTTKAQVVSTRYIGYKLIGFSRARQLWTKAWPGCRFRAFVYWVCRGVLCCKTLGVSPVQASPLQLSTMRLCNLLIGALRQGSWPLRRSSSAAVPHCLQIRRWGSGVSLAASRNNTIHMLNSCNSTDKTF